MVNNETIKKLIQQGEEIKGKYLKSTVPGFEVITQNEEYEKWKSDCVILLQRTNYNVEMTNRFVEESKKDSSIKHYNTMIGILRSFDELGEEPEFEDLNS